MTFDDWYDTVVKHVTPTDIYQWMYEAWDAGQQAEREACAKVCELVAADLYADSVTANKCAAAIRARGQS